jgi:hypothetical protein
VKFSQDSGMSRKDDVDNYVMKSMVINMSNPKPSTPKPIGKPTRTEPGAVKTGNQKPKP